jgi:hypothetical protein
MQDSVGMTKPNSSQNLSQERSHHGHWQSYPISDIIAGLVLVHECFQIVRHIFKDQIQSPWMGLNDIEQLDDIGMIEFSQETDFSNDVTWHSTLWGRVCKGDAFDGHRFASCIGGSFEDNTVGSLSNQVGSVVMVVVFVAVSHKMALYSTK